MRLLLRTLALWLIAGNTLLAAEQSFDLQGPRVDMRVKRGDQTLPISEVPNLMAGDRLWIHPDLPESQSAHFVLVVAFLRGVTNPPPAEWFTRVETWSKQVRSEGIFISVPEEAQQAILFLAPSTGGDFSTLRNAVRGRPGAFVRATQDLQAASMERVRLEDYLTELKVIQQNDPKSLKAHTELAARSLGIRLDQQCFDKPTDQQVPCLSNNSSGMVLDDSSSSTMVDQLTSGNTRDLMNQIASTPRVGSGVYSPYIGAIVDTARILSSLHSAHFQYIPALALPTKDTLNLRLNVPPSFRDPKSVVVVALPPVSPARMPLLRPVTPGEDYCAQNTHLVIPVEGAPLVFATPMGRELSLRIDTKAGPVEVKVHPDPAQGGMVPDAPLPHLQGEEMNAVLHGKWGFDTWDGPHFHLQSAHSTQWMLSPADQSAMVVGREDTLHLEDSKALCLERVEMQAGKAAAVKLNWKLPKPNTVELTVPLRDVSPGPVKLNFYQFGLETPDTLPLLAYAEAASIEKMTLNAGDQQAQLRGNRLDEVAKVTLGEIVWTPVELKRVQDFDLLAMNTTASTNALEPGKKATASVQLQDGRELRVPVSIQLPRPQITLLNKGTQEEMNGPGSPVHLSNSEDLPLNGKLVFFLRSVVPARFPRAQKVEVAAEDGSFHTQLSMTDGSLILEDANTAMGAIDPQSRFGLSAFGPVRVRAISEDGIAGDWIPLGTLVRLPGFRELRCPHSPVKPCVLSGSNLFLASAVSASQGFENPTEIPQDFTGNLIAVPHPANGQLWIKLRDDPNSVQLLTLPVQPMGGANVPPMTVPTQDPAAQSPAAPQEASAPAKDDK